MTNFKFEVIGSRDVPAHDVPKLYKQAPHLIWPYEIGIDETVVAATLIKFRRVGHPHDKGIPIILRQYIETPPFGASLILSQCFDRVTPNTIGKTAFLSAPGPHMDHEQQIANAIVKFWAAERMAGRL